MSEAFEYVIEEFRVAKPRREFGHIELRLVSTRMNAGHTFSPSSPSNRGILEKVPHTFSLHPAQAAALARKILEKVREP